MRHFLLSLVFSAFFAASLSPANAQVPRMFSYQGVVINPSTGNFIADGPHNITINLYDAFGAATPLFTENQAGVVFVKGIFNIMIGSVTPIPNNIGFNKGYFLGIQIDGGAEMTPRTAISPAPYSLHAAVADLAGGLVSGATNAVTSVNGISGDIKLKAGAGTITTNGDTIIISATGQGGTGIQGVQNSDASIVVANPTGPTASLSVAIGGITTSKLADGAVTATKIDGTGISSGMVLTANGLGGTVWLTPAVGGGGLTLPFTGTAAAATAGFNIVNSGTGLAGVFSVTNAASIASALWGNTTGGVGSTGVLGSTTGLGNAGNFQINNALNGSNALTGTTNGTGGAGLFTVTNAASNAFALEGISNGAANSVSIYGGNTGSGRAGFIEVTNLTNSSTAFTGKTQGLGDAVDVTIANSSNSSDALHTTTDGTGRAGYFAGTNAASSSATLEATTNGTSSTSYGIVGTHSATTGTAEGVRGVTNSTAANANGIVGIVTSTSPGTFSAGVQGVNNGISGNGVGVYGSHAGSGYGVYGTVNGNGFGVVGTANAGATNSGTGVWGVGSGTGVLAQYVGSNSGTAIELNNGFIKVSGANRTAYIHTTTAANTNGNTTTLSYAGMAATDIVFVTHNFSAAWLNNGYGVWWNNLVNKWEIFLENAGGGGAMPVGEKFNVLVIRQ